MCAGHGDQQVPQNRKGSDTQSQSSTSDVKDQFGVAHTELPFAEIANESLETMLN
jgi:hypothetical protein